MVENVLRIQADEGDYGSIWEVFGSEKEGKKSENPQQLYYGWIQSLERHRKHKFNYILQDADPEYDNRNELDKATIL